LSGELCQSIEVKESAEARDKKNHQEKADGQVNLEPLDNKIGPQL
jgi:hypothetical protein|tara:strand:+ start:794 stop:928 length:135 start_codon:yes stop_codon:yes gene_type:complete